MPNQNQPQPKPKPTQHDIELQRRGYKQRQASIEELLGKLSQLGRVVNKKPKSANLQGNENTKFEKVSGEQFLKSFLKV